jgi:3-mercaptopyruvate sulfurtransferase SseA
MLHVRGALEKMQEDSTTVPVAARSPKEFTGEITALPEYPTDHAQCGGHIPGAKNIPWAQAPQTFYRPLRWLADHWYSYLHTQLETGSI